MWRALLLITTGCAPFTPLSPVQTRVDSPPPTLQTTVLVCDDWAETWELSATTDGWVGQAELLLSLDGVEIERHPLYSVGAATDGRADELFLSLTIIADWRDVHEGSTTAFTCVQEPRALLRVFGVDGLLSDCWSSHPSTDIWETIDDCVSD